MPDISIHVNPDNPLIDEIISIKIKGVSGGEPYTIRSSILENGSKFSACGCYIANDEGVIDVTDGVCVGGTFTGIESMGLFWSLQQEPGHRRDVRIIKSDVTTPIKVTLSVYKGRYSWEDLCKTEHKPAVTSHINRWYKAKDVQRLPVRTGRVRGRLFIPPGRGPFPGVIDIFGGMGGLMEFRASLLASRGFVTLALAYFNYEDLPSVKSGETHLDIDYFTEAAEFLSSHSAVKGDRIGVIGVSKGAEFAMMMTKFSQKVAATVFINGPPYLSVFDMKIGQSIYECVDKDLGFDFSKLRITEEGIAYRDAYNYYKPTDIVEIWKTGAKVLSIVGEDDQTLDPAIPKVLLDACPKEQISSIEIKSYPGAGHLIEPPYMPLCRKSYVPHLGMNQLWGGQKREHSVAQQDSWLRIQQHFRKHLNSDDSKLLERKSRL